MTPMAPMAEMQAETPPEEPPPPPKPVHAQVNALTIDVKEWFQTAACSEAIKFSHWGKYERRVEMGIHIILALLRQHGAKATFFVLGIVAREFPEMVRLIKQEGHEIGVCGYYNRMLYSIPPKDYINELEMSLSLLKSLINQDVVVHRAPGWSVTPHTLWVMDVLSTYGIKYDSSIYPVKAPMYGIEGSPRFPYVINPQGITEFPPSTFSFMGKNVALFGGAYLRILPFPIISMGMESLNRDGHPGMLHISPWEMEGEIPRVKLGWEGYLAQYAGLKSTFPKVARLLEKYKFDTVTNVLQKNPATDAIHITTLKKSSLL